MPADECFDQLSGTESDRLTANWYANFLTSLGDRPKNILAASTWYATRSPSMTCDKTCLGLLYPDATFAKVGVVVVLLLLSSSVIAAFTFLQYLWRVILLMLYANATLRNDCCFWSTSAAAHSRPLVSCHEKSYAYMFQFQASETYNRHS